MRVTPRDPRQRSAPHSRSGALLVAALLVLAASGPLRAGEGRPSPAPDPRLDQEAWTQRGQVLPFWEILPSAFHAETPRPIRVPGVSETMGAYWSWVFRFRVETNLEEMATFLRQTIPAAKIDAQPHYRRQLERVEETLKKPVRLQLFIAIYTDTGEIIADTSNPFVRNLAEREHRGRLQTVAEINAEPLERGALVEGVATFPRLDSRARSFEIRVYGLGNRFSPSYQPGELLYRENTYGASIQRALRFAYRRVGGGETALEPIRLERRWADWIWLWPSQVYMGHVRDLEVRRATGRTARFRYVPYRILNDTNREQPLAVREAGLRVPVRWRGEPIELRFTDAAGRSDLWTTQALRAIGERVATGKERELVEAHEMPADADEEAAAREAEAKAAVLPEGENRHPQGPIAAGKVARGLMLLRWEIDDLPQRLRRLVARFRGRALAAGGAGGATSELYTRAYASLRPAVEEGTPLWRRPPEPADDAVLETLRTLAEEDLGRRGVAVTPWDVRRYGDLAPVGVLLRELADETVERRAREGVVDGAFEVVWDGMVDRSTFPSSFRRRFPAQREPYEPPDIDATTPVSTPASASPWDEAVGGGAEGEGWDAGEEEEDEDGAEDFLW